MAKATGKTAATTSTKSNTRTGSAAKSNSAVSTTSVMNQEHTEGSGNRKPLEKFFLDALKDIYGAEQALVAALTRMQQAATTPELQEAFEDHALLTQKHILRLEKVFRSMGQEPEAGPCAAMQALIQEGEQVITTTPEGSMTRDAALIIGAQKIEHLEIACYGGLVQLAITMEEEEVADILDRTLSEEEDTDVNLTEIAESFINFEAEEEPVDMALEEAGDQE